MTFKLHKEQVCHQSCMTPVAIGKDVDRNEPMMIAGGWRSGPWSEVKFHLGANSRAMCLFGQQSHSATTYYAKSLCQIAGGAVYGRQCTRAGVDLNVNPSHRHSGTLWRAQRVGRLVPEGSDVGRLVARQSPF